MVRLAACVLAVSVLQCALGRGKELGQIQPATVGSEDELAIELAPKGNVEFFQDFHITPAPKVVVTQITPDGRELTPDGKEAKEKKGPLVLHDCWRWEIDVVQGSTKAHLSCDPIGRSDRCSSEMTSGGEHEKIDCSVKDCAVSLPDGGATTIKTKLRQLQDCPYQIKRHVLRVVEVAAEG